eukprot:SAG31_NODE_7723_length_1608_cov_2.069583_1_plen_148_part_00
MDPATIAYILGHCNPKLFIVDTAFSSNAAAALEILKREDKPLPIVVDVIDAVAMAETGASLGEPIGAIEYEEMLASASKTYDWVPNIKDEWQAISLNYTSGTTGRPKGVVYHHRGAYLLAMGNIVDATIPKHFRYLWTLPMFHCNGW